MITHIHTITIYVEDQNKSLGFWMQKLGFVIRKNVLIGQNANWIELGPDKGQTCLVLYPRSMMLKWNELRASIVFYCTDVEEEFRKLTGKGVEFIGEVKKSPAGKSVKFKDLDGNEFLLKSD